MRHEPLTARARGCLPRRTLLAAGSAAAAGAWSDSSRLTGWIPSTFDGWQAARRVLNACDPARVFGNDFPDRLLP